MVFDDIDSIEQEEKLFRHMGLPGLNYVYGQSVFCVGEHPLPNPLVVHWQGRLPHHRRQSPLHIDSLDQVCYINFRGHNQRQNHYVQRRPGQEDANRPSLPHERYEGGDQSYRDQVD